MGTQTHLGMHHKRIPSGSAAAASEAAAPAVVLGKRDDVIGAARNLQMGTQTHLGMHNVVIPSASSAKAVKAAPVQEEVKDLKQGHQEGAPTATARISRMPASTTRCRSIREAQPRVRVHHVVLVLIPPPS